MNKTDELFEPIAHESVADAVVHQIEGLIISGVLKEGRKLPSERELAELLDVSRPKLREALKTLEERGLTRAQHGDGTFIAPLIGSAMSKPLIELYQRHIGAFYDYLEYRREQEGFAAMLAAERATDVDKQIIQQIIDSMKKAHELNDEEQSMKLDIDLHVSIVDASHNTTLAHMMQSIYELTSSGVFYNREYLRSVDSNGDALLAQHLKLGNAVLDGNPQLARTAAYEHLDFVEAAYQTGELRRRRENLSTKRLLLHNTGSV